MIFLSAKRSYLLDTVGWEMLQTERQTDAKLQRILNALS